MKIFENEKRFTYPNFPSNSSILAAPIQALAFLGLLINILFINSLAFLKSPISASVFTGIDAKSVKYPFRSTVLNPSTESLSLSSFTLNTVPLALPKSLTF